MFGLCNSGVGHLLVMERGIRNVGTKQPTTKATTPSTLTRSTCQPTCASGSSKQEQYRRRLPALGSPALAGYDREAIWRDLTPKIAGGCCPHASASDGTLLTTPSPLKASTPLARSNRTEASVRFMLHVASCRSTRYARNVRASQVSISWNGVI